VVQSINPATLEVNAEIPATRVEEIPGIVHSARQAQAEWAKLNFQKRNEYLRKVNEYIIANIDDIAKTITLDNGKTRLEAVTTELYPVMDALSFVASDAKMLFREEKLCNPIFKVARIESGNIYEPMGVVGIISPWNFPFAIPMTQMVMALAVGNTVIFKPSNFTALVGDLIDKIFKAADFPEGVVRVVQGEGAVLGDPLIDAKLDKIIFTGSIPVGKHLMAKAAETLTPITLELGGKDPFIVLEDADIHRASSAAVWGAFVNAGQVCASVERVYVHKRVAEKFVEQVVEKTNKISVGNGMRPNTDMGPMINEERIRTVEAHIGDAVAKGARILTGGHRINRLPGYFFEPTVLAGVNHKMDCLREETFGPTLPIMTFSETDEAVALANDSRYGLLSSVWSKDVAKAKGIGRRIQAGTVIVNNALITYGFTQCPWGGVKDSGIGTTHSIHGLREFMHIKNITINKSLLHEDIWWYPYNQAKFDGLKAGLKSLYCGGLLCRAGGVMDVLKSFKLLGKK
jgi:succinate-semialdehyde dehydrogenase/glutarate-semialdehyde dehydrogenase